MIWVVGVVVYIGLACLAGRLLGGPPMSLAGGSGPHNLSAPWAPGELYVRTPQAVTRGVLETESGRHYRWSCDRPSYLTSLARQTTVKSWRCPLSGDSGVGAPLRPLRLHNCLAQVYLATPGGRVRSELLPAPKRLASVNEEKQ